jgi:tetratricopeptide (TPR) repeat protein
MEVPLQRSAASRWSIRVPADRLAILLWLVVMLTGCERRLAESGGPPPAPDLSGASDELRRKVAEAEALGRAESTQAEAWARLGRLYHANGYAAAAEQTYRSRLELAPSDAQTAYLAARLLADYGRIADAEPLFQQVVQLAPDYAPARLKLAELFVKSARRAEAEAEFRAVLALDAESPWAQHGLARLAAEEGRWPEARRLLERVTARHPDFFAANSLLVTVYETLGQTEAAERPRRRARLADRFREPPDPWFEALDEACFDAYQLQVRAAAAGDGERALLLLERALTLEPNSVSVLRQLALVHMRAGRRDAADTAIRRARAEGATNEELENVRREYAGRFAAPAP